MKKDNSLPWLMLPFRLLLFLMIQAIFALILLAVGRLTSWQESARWWPLGVAFADVVTLVILVRLYKREGNRYWSEYKLDKTNFWKDFGLLLGSLVIGGPLSVAPNLLLANWLYGDTQATLPLFVGQLPAWAIIASIVLFPLGQAITELAFYMRFCAPRLEKQGLPVWVAVGLASLFLSLQHVTAPLVLDWRFIVWRALMYLPFAVYTGILLHWRPRLLPMLAVIHFLMNLSFAVMYLPTA
ncbi:MAG: hypothetical protein HPY85_09990 [Anaerolineae bacterium]|nr:hypothetical protein [Anaerolineae bacterium]